MQRQWKTTGIITGALALLLVLAPAGRAQEQAEDEGEAVNPGAGLFVSRELKREKRREARAGEWAFTLQGSADVGYDSNIYRSSKPDTFDGNIKDSAFSGFAARAEALRYFTRDDHFEVGVEGGYVSYFENHEADPISGELELQYEHTFSKAFRMSLMSGVQMDNDHATNINGAGFSRNFRNTVYKSELGGVYTLAKVHDVSLSYFIKRKDYVATANLNDLDWLEQGPEFRYKWEIAKPVDLRLWYDFSIQQYDTEPANDLNGAELGTPEEEHFFHKALAWLSIAPTDDVKLNFKYTFEVKDDRFVGYESYKNHGIEGGFNWGVTKAFSWETTAYLDLRQYKHRENTAPTDPSLEYDKLGIDTTGRYELNKYVSLYALYSFARRDTNRPLDSGTSYRDYTVHMAGAGVSVAM
ncbi:MAG: hypothetical protein AB1405_02430 [Bdellovibrionota bacterium]